MTRTVDVASLNDHEKENAILLLAAYAKDLRRILDDQAQHNGFIRRELETLDRQHGPRMGFFERVWTREFDHHAAERKAHRMDLVWERAEGPR